MLLRPNLVTKLSIYAVYVSFCIVFHIPCITTTFTFKDSRSIHLHQKFLHIQRKKERKFAGGVRGGEKGNIFAK